MVEAEREVDGAVSKERSYYLCLVGSVEEFAHASRGHWSIENGLHWVLDGAFREDHNRTRKDHSAHNFAILRHIALNLLKAERSVKVGGQGQTAQLWLGPCLSLQGASWTSTNLDAFALIYSESCIDNIANTCYSNCGTPPRGVG